MQLASDFPIRRQLHRRTCRNPFVLDERYKFVRQMHNVHRGRMHFANVRRLRFEFWSRIQNEPLSSLVTGLGKAPASNESPLSSESEREPAERSQIVHE